MNKVEFCQKNVFFLVSPGTYGSTCYVFGEDREVLQNLETLDPCRKYDDHEFLERP